MRVDVLTLFPELFSELLRCSILGRAAERGLVQVILHQIRDYARDKHQTTDDSPYGGGPGMVMKPEPLFAAWEAACAASLVPASTILFSPQGQPMNQALVAGYAAMAGAHRWILVCGRYEGIDERFIEECVDQELSLGDFVLTGGEIAAMAWVDSVARLLPGVLGNENSSAFESFSAGNRGLLEGPQYTRPPEFRGRKVPEPLLSGDHRRIQLWREEQALKRTRDRRPELLSEDPHKSRLS